MSSNTETEAASSSNKKKRKVVKDIEVRCNGITCGLEKIRWCHRSNFHPNTIPATRKQCLRCSLFTTAMKSTAKILIDIQHKETSIHMKFAKLLKEKNRQKKIDFTSLMNMLKKYIPTNEQFSRAQYISKNRPTEKWKRICKLLLELSGRTTNKPISSANIANNIQSWISDIEQTIHIKDSELKLDNLFMRKCMKEFQKDLNAPDPTSTSTATIPTPQQEQSQHQTNHSQITSIIHAADSPKQENSTTTSEEPIDLLSGPSTPTTTPENATQTLPSLENISDTNRELILRAKLSLMNRRSYLSGGIILLALEVLRDEHATNNIFLACPEAASITLAWNPNEGWKRFARIFYSNRVCNENPNGLYIIPVFSENHWSVIAIEKKRRHRKAAIIDSLGTGTTNSPLIQLINQAFKPNRGRVHWETPTSRRQTGV